MGWQLLEVWGLCSIYFRNIFSKLFAETVLVEEFVD